jgi:enoyl-CoA hydratase
MSTPVLNLNIADGVARIALDDGKANALNPALFSELRSALDRAESEKAALVVHGRTGFFSGGLDIKTLPALPPEDLRRALFDFLDLMLRIFTWPRPAIAASTGHAIAGGTVLMLACDERLVADGQFKMGLSETAIGLTLPRFVVEMAKVQLSPAVLGRVVVQGGLFSPRDAKELGIADRIVAPDSVIEEAVARAKKLAALPDASYRGNKLSIRAEAAERGRVAFPAELDAFMATFTRLG